MVTIDESTRTRRSPSFRIRNLAEDSRGSTIIEFAFVAGPFIALLIAILQTSLTFFAQQNLESVAEKAGRQLLIGSAQSAGLDKETFRNSVCSKLPVFMKCNNLMVDVQVATAFSAANTATPTLTYDSSGKVTNNWAWKPGGPGEITVMRTMYVWDVQKGPLGFDLSTLSNRKRVLITTNVFKTEPYSS